MAIHSPLLLGLGIAALVLGIAFWRWAGRHSVDLKGAAVRSAIATARSGKLPGVPESLQGHVDRIAAADGTVGRAKVVGGTVARHFMAKVMRLLALAALLAGVALVAAALLWK
jgi:hypothetical protein